MEEQKELKDLSKLELEALYGRVRYQLDVLQQQAQLVINELQLREKQNADKS